MVLKAQKETSWIGGQQRALEPTNSKHEGRLEHVILVVILAMVIDHNKAHISFFLVVMYFNCILVH